MYSLVAELEKKQTVEISRPFLRQILQTLGQANDPKSQAMQIKLEKSYPDLRERSIELLSVNVRFRSQEDMEAMSKRFRADEKLPLYAAIFTIKYTGNAKRAILLFIDRLSKYVDSKTFTYTWRNIQ